MHNVATAYSYILAMASGLYPKCIIITAFHMYSQLVNILGFINY